MKFKVVVNPGADFGFVVEAPSLPGCISQGDTIEEALNNIREAIELYIEDMAPSEVEKAVSSAPRIY